MLWIALAGLIAMLSFEAFPEKSDYILNERIRLRVRIVNQGSDTVDLPDPQEPTSDQPAIGLIGPSFPSGKLFSSLTALQEATGNPNFAPPAPARIRIAPGAMWEGSAPITPSVQILDPGEYRVRSILAYQQTRTTSQESRFRVNAVTPTSVHLGLGVRPFQAGQGEIVFVQPGEKTSGIYVFRFDENTAVAEMEHEKPIHRTTIPASAADVALPSRNAPYFNELLRWIVWREGKSIKALSSVITTPLSVDLPAAPAYLAQPPLKTTGGPVEVLSVSADHKELTLIEISSGPVGQDPGARILWRAPLPAAPLAITAALAPLSHQSERHIAFAAPSASGFDIFHARYTQAGLQSFQQIHIERGRLLPDTPPALFIDAAGQVKVAVLAATDDACLLAEVEFDATPKAKLTTLKARPTAGAALYSQNEAAPLRLDVVVAEGPSILHLNASGQLAPVPVQGQPTAPILLAPGEHVSYIVYTDPKKGVYFEAL